MRASGGRSWPGFGRPMRKTLCLSVVVRRWNPDESGTGYNIQVRHGVMVVTTYSYIAGGDPLWYLTVGTLVNAGGGVMASGTLDKFRGGAPPAFEARRTQYAPEGFLQPRYRCEREWGGTAGGTAAPGIV